MNVESLLDRLRREEQPKLVLDPEPQDTPASVALLSGSFDPMTVAHESMAEAAAGRAGLVALVYSARTLPKDPGAPPPFLDEGVRIETLRRFCGARPGMAVGLCSHGLLADQVRAARLRFAAVELSLVVGSDKVLQILDPRWYDDRDAALEPMLTEAHVLYAVRAGEDEAVRDTLARPENARWRGRFERLPVSREIAAISSREVRELIRAGRDVGALVPEEVREVLQSYR
jgi:nicotinic acid mononucleotide adenylyltransferase